MRLQARLREPVHLHREAAQRVRAVLGAVTPVGLGEDVHVHLSPGLARRVGVQVLGIPEAFHVHGVFCDARCHMRLPAHLAATAFHPHPLLVLHAVLLGGLGMDADQRHRIQLAQIRNVAQRAVMVVRNASLGQHDGIFRIGEVRLLGLQIVDQRIVIFVGRRHDVGFALGARPRLARAA